MYKKLNLVLEIYHEFFLLFLKQQQTSKLTFFEHVVCSLINCNNMTLRHDSREHKKNSSLLKNAHLRRERSFFTKKKFTMKLDVVDKYTRRWLRVVFIHDHELVYDCMYGADTIFKTKDQIFFLNEQKSP